MENPLSIDIGGLLLENPVMTASGTFGFGREFEPLVDLNRMGAVIVKGLSREPSPGNPPPRIIETPCGMLNAIGLENIGIDVFIRDKLPFLRQFSCAVIVNAYGKTPEDYAAVAQRCEGVEGIDALEINISCPNVKAGGVSFGVDPAAAAEVVSAVREKTDRPMIVKLSPNVTDIVCIAEAVAAAGADALSLINTLTGMVIDIHKRRPKLGNITGGLSGPAIKPVALRMVWQAAQAVNVPVIGIGGINTAEDALEFIIAGASAVQVGTANFTNPAVTMEVIEGIGSFLQQQGINHIKDLIGTLKTD
ncbi:MAG: dihydroorotate dehydrogenase [Desulfobacterales bacterium]|nr:dihydroorotate dehydrogenase [Desulfobacterales bacterium]